MGQILVDWMRPLKWQQSWHQRELLASCYEDGEEEKKEKRQVNTLKKTPLPAKKKLKLDHSGHLT